MPSATNIKARVEARIRSAGLTLTVHYPATRPAATGTAPGTAPVSPLTGPVPVTEVVVTDPTPRLPAVTLACNWLQSYSSVTTSVRKDMIDHLRPGWVEGASALATVAVEDAALDSAQPYGDTVFTGASHVEYQAKRYTILSVQPVGPSFADPYVYYVWLTGAAKQG